VIVWRVCRERFSNPALDGEGARLYGGRWNLPGVRLVYTASSLSLAALELLVHVDHEDAPDDLVSVRIDVPDDLRIDEWSVADLPRDWGGLPAPPVLQEMGAGWAKSRAAAVLRVPSAVVPVEFNCLINPAHPEAARVEARVTGRFVLDPRLLR